MGPWRGWCVVTVAISTARRRYGPKLPRSATVILTWRRWKTPALSSPELPAGRARCSWSLSMTRIRSWHSRLPHPALGSEDDPAVTAEVEYVGVRPGGWGAGLAHGVLELLCAELAADGFTRAQLLVYVSNRRAVSLYERLGWQAEGRPQPHRRTGKPEQRYRRTLGR